MSQELSENDKAEIWKIACAKGIDVGRARAYWEAEKQAQQQAQQVQQQTQQQITEEPIETEESETEESEEESEEEDFSIKDIQEAMLRKKKSLILDKINAKLDEDKKEENFEETLKAQYQKTIKDKIVELEESNRKQLGWIIELNQALDIDTRKFLEPIYAGVMLLKLRKANRIHMSFGITKDGKYFMERVHASIDPKDDISLEESKARHEKAIEKPKALAEEKKEEKKDGTAPAS